MNEAGRTITPKVCDECKKLCMPLPCSSNPKASEWYCETDHKSYRMEVEVAEAILVAEMQGRRRKG